MSLLSTIFDYAPHLELIGKFGGAVAVLWGAKKYVVSPLAAKLIQWKKWCLRLAKGLEAIERIELQFKNNGGSSLRDRIDMLDSRLTFMEARDNIMLDDSPTAIFICDQTGTNSYCNRTYCRLLKCGRDDLSGQNWRNFIVEEKLESYEELWKPAFQQNREINTDVLFKTSEGLTRCCHVVISPLNRPEDKLRRFIGRIQINKECSTCAKAGKPCAMRESA